MFVNAVRHITFDALDPYRIAEFWSAVTGFAIHPDDVEGDDEVMLESGQQGFRACCSSGSRTPSP